MKSAKAEDVSICAYEGDEIKNEIFGANVSRPLQRPPHRVIPTGPKSPGLVVIFAWLLPSAGHAFVGNWARGAQFVLVDLG